MSKKGFNIKHPYVIMMTEWEAQNFNEDGNEVIALRKFLTKTR